MRRVTAFKLMAIWLIVLLIAAPPAMAVQDPQPGEDPFRPEELDQMLAPIALYPDSLLMQILAASTYPVEVVQADRWVKQHPDLKGDALDAALEQQNWDPSIMAMTQFPDVLAMMSEKLDWTTELGDAFLAQQRDVMDSIQRLRQRAHESGNLASTEQQKVIVERETIVIEPAQPQVIYVPAYNPTVVYGASPYPAYPPYYYYPPGYVVGAAAFSFAAGVAIGAAAWGHWGHWGCDWHHREVYKSKTVYKKQVNINVKGGGGRETWKHNPGHRKGAGYRDRDTAKRYGQDRPGRGQTKRDYRGHEGGRVSTADRRGQLARTEPSQRRSDVSRPRTSGSEKGRDLKGKGRDLSGKGKDLSGKGRDLSGRRPEAPGGPGRDIGQRSSGQSRQNAFSGAGSGGRDRAASYRGNSSRNKSSVNRAGPSRSGGSGAGRGGGGSGGGGRRR